MPVIVITRFITALQRRRRPGDEIVDDLLISEVVDDGLLPVGPPSVVWRAWCSDPIQGVHACPGADEDDPNVVGWQLAVSTAALQLRDREDN